MKTCKVCQRILQDKREQCPECGGKTFQTLTFPFYDIIEQKEEDDDSRRDAA